MRLRPSMDPWRELVDLHERVEQAFRDLSAPAQVELAWRPPAESLEDERGYVLRFDLPGVPVENIKLQVEEGSLWLSGQKPEPPAEGRVARRERRYGRFSVAAPLPRDADYEAATAELEQGVLTVILPRRAGRRTHRIPVQWKKTSE
ncbi:MAG: Hsp20/alpha crystallin family protein [candidate division WS1 bacterium]|nr:Hsp20/alpha crystallin family protein [candidate division WS1 bacterium]